MKEKELTAPEKRALFLWKIENLLTRRAEYQKRKDFITKVELSAEALGFAEARRSLASQTSLFVVLLSSVDEQLADLWGECQELDLEFPIKRRCLNG